MSNGTNPPKKRGCLFYGCLSVAIVGLVLILVGILAYYLARQWAIRTVNHYTDSSPAVFEYPTNSAAEQAALEERVSAFAKAIKQGGTSEELILTADDLNNLIAQNAEYRGKVFVFLEEDRVRGKVSIPLNEVIPPELRGKLRMLQNRFLNGEVTFRVALEGGALDVRLDQVQVKGNPLDKAPLVGPMVAEMKKRNLAQEIQQNSRDAETLRKCNSLEVKDGKIIIRGK